MTKGLIATLAGLALLWPAAAQAQRLPEGLYFEGRGGGVLLNDAANSSGGFTLESEFDPGFLVEGALGYAHDSGWRIELALGYRQNEIDDLVIANDGGLGAALGVGSLNGLSLASLGVSLDGEFSNLSFMVNGYYEFQTGRFRPFLGAGVGIAHIMPELSLSVPGLSVQVVDDSDDVLAYQGTVGLAFHFDEEIAATLAYSYFATSDPEFEFVGGGGFDSEYQSHAIMVGLRFTR